MKILMIIDTLTAGGKERRMLELIKGLLQKKEYDIEVVILSENIFYDQIFNLNIKVHTLTRKIKKDPLIIINLFKICKKFNPDIIQSWEPMASVYSLVVAKLLGIKLINAMIVDAPSKLLYKLWIRSKITFPLSDIISANSYAGLRSYKVPVNKSICVHNGFDFERIKCIENADLIRKKFNVRTDKVIGMVGSMSKRKDFKTYLLAAKRILEKRIDVTFLAVGSGENYERYVSMVEDQFKDKIIFTGNQKDVESIINIFNIGVLISENDKYWNEGISNSILEYMALGKPVIATDSGGTKEIVVNNKTGFIIQPENVDELFSKIDYLLDHTDIAQKMGEKGKCRIQREFSIDKMISAYEEIYESILSNKST